MAKLSSFKHSAIHRVCVYGGPKAGKTELVGQLSSKYKLLWFDLENGFETLLKLSAACQDNIELVRIPDTKVYPIAAETMLKVISGVAMDICEKHGKVNCALCKKNGDPVTRVALNELGEDWIVVVDSMTQLANSVMNHITKDKEDTYKPEWGDYRNQGALMDKFLSQVQQARYNVICITHEAEVEMEDGRKKLVPVAGTTNFSRNTAKYFDHVVYVEVRNKKHCAASSTTYANNILTGSRTDAALEKKEAPTLFEIFTEVATQAAPAAPATAATAATAAKSEGNNSLAALAALQKAKGLTK